MRGVCGDARWLRNCGSEFCREWALLFLCVGVVFADVHSDCDDYLHVPSRPLAALGRLWYASGGIRVLLGCLWCLPGLFSLPDGALCRIATLVKGVSSIRCISGSGAFRAPLVPPGPVFPPLRRPVQNRYCY